ncbi:MAG: phenylphosphate carboxylase subunit delta [Planctomycetota bacterium]|nr:MAG: phenylphosphate carboxylase subunit delta [Planctomycetota bacterium]
MTPLAVLCRKIRLLVLDVDGVLTQGHLMPAVASNGTTHSEAKWFHVRDGLALRVWQDAGGEVAVITGRGGDLVEARCKELGITRLIQGANPKTPAFLRLLAETNTPPEAVCAMGDDLADVPLLDQVGLGVAVADACLDARRAAKITTRLGGGFGAVREVVELIMRERGTWPAA